MTAIEINDSSRPSGEQSHIQQPVDDKEIVTVITYAKLIEYHLERRALDKAGNQRHEQSLKNERSVIGSWLTKHKLSPSDSVGEELGVSFNERLAKYCHDNEHSGLAKQTVSDRKTILTKLHGSFLELRRTDGLPDDFGRALKRLVKEDNTSLRQIARKTGISRESLRSWINGTKTPYPKSFPHVRKLEKVLKVSPGTLSSRLPGAHWSKQSMRRCTTTWRAHLSILLRLQYRLPMLIGLPREEWYELVQFYTNPQWAIERGFETNSEWRVRWNTNRCPTAEMHLGFVLRFFGFLCQPVVVSDERIAGLGFDPQTLTLALLTDADLARRFSDFMKCRSVSGSFNSGTLKFLNLCTMLTRSETGYLRQRPEFGARLPQPIMESDWPSWCERNRLKMLEFREEITNGKKSKKSKNGKKDRVRMTRDPFEPVIEIITERQHPITALFDLADRLESLTPLLERGPKHVLAVHSRAIFQVRLIGSNPLRGENFSMMTHIPQDQDTFEKACKRYREEKQMPDFSELYVKTTEDSNLYQKPDGSWRLRFNERDFKNERGEDLEPGIRNAAYDVPVVPSVWPALIEYLFKHRPILNELLVDTLRVVRAKRGLPVLTAEEELAVMRCRYVFRQGPQGIHHIGTEQLLAGYGTGQMPVKTLSSQMLILTSRHLPESKGFSAHACRHLVATEYIKNEPNGWNVAAEALHITAEMVRKHYSRVVVGDRIKPWNDHHERLKGMHDRGEI